MSLSLELDHLPPALRALLDAELAAGNAVAEIVAGFPAPPAGFCVLLERPVGTRAGTADDGLVYEEWPNWKGYNGYTDARRHFFVLNPPNAQTGPEYPVMRYDANGAAISVSPPGNLPAMETTASPAEPMAPEPDSDGRSGSDLTRRFRESLQLDYEKWREGIGYDLDADEQAGAETLLLSRSISDWRDVQALAWLDTEKARAALRSAMASGNARIRTAVLRYAPELASREQRIATLVAAVASAKSFEGLGETLDAIADFHPPELVAALWRGLESREGEVAVHFAALLYFIHGLTDEPFDWNHRPFFLRFHSEDKETRKTAIAELRRRIDDSGDSQTRDGLLD